MKLSEKDKQLYFEQYKVLVESAEKVSDKRMSANNYFLTINTGLISLAGILLTSKIVSLNTLFIVFIGYLGLAICATWFFIVLSYKQLNSGKFKLIHKIEKELPIKLFADEWKELGEGRSLRKYIPLSHIEVIVPVVFFVFYLFLIFYNF